MKTIAFVNFTIGLSLSIKTKVLMRSQHLLSITDRCMYVLGDWYSQTKHVIETMTYY